MDSELIEGMLKDIPSSFDWVNVDKIDKGWSKDKKYCIQNTIGEKFLLRVSDSKLYDEKRKEFEFMKEVYRLGIDMSKPIDFGVCGQGKFTYSLLSWIDGESLDGIIKHFKEEEQYRLGFEAGKILKKIHSIEAVDNKKHWNENIQKKLKRHLDSYKNCGIQLQGDENIINYIKSNLKLLENRPQCYQHGDFHTGNLVKTPNNTIGVIDFNRWGYGDPYEEFLKLLFFSRENSIEFTKGQLQGYFQEGIPKDFFEITSIYLADTILFSIAWAIPFGDEEVEEMIKRANMILEDYDNFNRVYPKWFN